MSMKSRMVLVFVFALVAGIAYAQSVPQLINYQGRMADDSGTPLAGNTTVD